MRVYGVDFTCAPRKAKPITVASGVLRKNAVAVEKIEKLHSFEEFEALLGRPGPWIGGFDFPFALPAELARDLKWPHRWKDLVAHCSAMTRAEFRSVLDLYRASRRVGQKYAHRATDYPAGSSSPMKLVNPPVALMFHEGARRLLASGVHLPALADGDSARVALEAYPGLLARKQLGIRDSYKSDARSEQTRSRQGVRMRIMKELKKGRPLGVRLKISTTLERAAIEDGSGDLLDAAICAVQACWGWQRRQQNYGLPEDIDPQEGWIVSA